MVYNRNADGLRIASVRLKQAYATPFRVNVDGSYLEPESGSTGIRFRGAYGEAVSNVFAEVTMPEKTGRMPPP